MLFAIDSEGKKRIGRFFKEARLSAGLTQKELANTLGYSSPQLVSNWERGACEIPTKSMETIAQALCLSHDQISHVLIEEIKRYLKVK